VIDINYSLFIQIANFLLLILILNYLLYRPILRIIEKRESYLRSSEDEIRNIQETVDRKAAEYEDSLRIAKKQALEQKNEITRVGAEDGKAIIDAVRNELPGIMEEFQKNINSEVDKARHILQTQSKAISLEIAEKVLGRSIQ
jgi:F-type H+-transporting ATPase subunit b